MNTNHFCKTAQKRIESFSKRPVLFFCKKFIHDKLSLEDRKEFRHFLVEKIKAQNFYKDLPLDHLLKAGSRPELSFLALSISHCKNLACFVFSPKDDSPSEKLSIGLDIEKTSRVSRQIVSRISSPREKSPSPSLLWTAKEASFKCFSKKKQALLLSDCFISNWKKSPFEKTYLFKAESKGKKVQGFACFIDSITLAYAESS